MGREGGTRSRLGRQIPLASRYWGSGQNYLHNRGMHRKRVMSDERPPSQSLVRAQNEKAFIKSAGRQRYMQKRGAEQNYLTVGMQERKRHRKKGGRATRITSASGTVQLDAAGGKLFQQAEINKASKWRSLAKHRFLLGLLGEEIRKGEGRMSQKKMKKGFFVQLTKKNMGWANPNVLHKGRCEKT